MSDEKYKILHDKFENESNIDEDENMYSSNYLDSLENINSLNKKIAFEVYKKNYLKHLNKFPGQIISVEKEKVSELKKKNNTFDLDFISVLSPDALIDSYKVRVPIVDGILSTVSFDVNDEKNKYILDLYSYYTSYNIYEKYDVGDYVYVEYKNRDFIRGGRIISKQNPIKTFNSDNLAAGSGAGFLGKDGLVYSSPDNPLPENQVRDLIRENNIKNNARDLKSDDDFGVFSQSFFDDTPTNMRGLYAGWLYAWSYEDIKEKYGSAITSYASREALYSNAINRYSNALGVDHRIIRAIICKESNYIPKAASGAGGAGLTQFTPLGLTAILDNAKNRKIFLDNYQGPIDVSKKMSDYDKEAVIKKRKNKKGKDIPYVAEYLGPETKSLREDPDASILSACITFKPRMSMYNNDLTKAIAAHNSGDAKHLKAKGRDWYRYLVAENKDFISKVIFFYIGYTKKYPG